LILKKSLQVFISVLVTNTTLSLLITNYFRFDMFTRILVANALVTLGCFVFRIARTLSSHRVPTIHVPFWILTQLVPGFARFNYPTIYGYSLHPGSILRLSISTANFLFKIVHAFLLFHLSTPPGRWKARYA